VNDPDPYERFRRPVPEWFLDAKLGIFVHWGPYSVPAWAEPIGPLGAFDDDYWFRHSPYAEWYGYSILLEGSGAQRHHREVFGDAPYDDFLDAWKAERFDAGAVMDVVASTGARYFIPTTKHHDGVTLWDAPGTGDRNTVRRGPRRDLVAEFAGAARERDIRFGVYYSGGFDWHVSPPPATVERPLPRPNDLAYAEYAYDHAKDLIDRHRPDIFWNDIEWPDAGKTPGPTSLVSLFAHHYATTPEGVVNDRFGGVHWDFRTSEYVANTAVEAEGAWENCRGIGYSFGYNAEETAEHHLDGPAVVSYFVDVVSRGGNLLLNVGLAADGTIPRLQRHALDALGDWNDENGQAIFGSRPLAGDVGAASDDPWVRWTATPGMAHAFVRGGGTEVVLRADPARLDPGSARFADGTPARARATADGLAVGMGGRASATPVRISFETR
jgi:alpha-L-fucosidase